MTNIDERAEARMALQKILWDLDIDPEKININSMGLFEDYIMQARATLPTAEASAVRALVEAGCLLCASIGCAAAENAAAKRWSKALETLVEARDTVKPTAEVSEDEVARVMAEGMEPTYSDTYSSRELAAGALRDLSKNGYKVVRK